MGVISEVEGGEYFVELHLLAGKHFASIGVISWDLSYQLFLYFLFRLLFPELRGKGSSILASYLIVGILYFPLK